MPMHLSSGSVRVRHLARPVIPPPIRARCSDAVFGRSITRPVNRVCRRIHLLDIGNTRTAWRTSIVSRPSPTPPSESRSLSSTALRFSSDSATVFGLCGPPARFLLVPTHEITHTEEEIELIVVLVLLDGMLEVVDGGVVVAIEKCLTGKAEPQVWVLHPVFIDPSSDRSRPFQGRPSDRRDRPGCSWPRRLVCRP